MTLSINSTTTPNSSNIPLLEQNKQKTLPSQQQVSQGFEAKIPDSKKLTSDKVELKGKFFSDDYKDPLMQWPWRGLAFTNDIGAAVMDIAPNLGMGLWVPALMYFGADIYDKYKSDKKEYNPDTKRAFKQTVFQALASVMMPIVVVHNGQKAASALAMASKSGMSLQLREEIEQYTVNHLKRRKLKDYEGNIDRFKKEFNEHLKQHLLDQEKSFETKNPFKLLGRWIFGARHGEKMTDAKLKEVEKYTNKNIDEMFAIRSDLLKDKRPKGLSDKLVKFFDKTKRAFSKDQNTIEGYVEDSIKATLKQRQRDQLFRTKLWKTAGGFIALGATIKFIDHFVENFVIKKIVEPGLENIEVSDKGIQFGKKRSNEIKA